MNSPAESVVGIDVGGGKKGYHAVALRNRVFGIRNTSDPAAIVDWCVECNALFVAVDAPCGWSRSCSSRLSERELKLGGQKIHCFATPARSDAKVHNKGFYDWVFNGEKLYRQLALQHYSLFDGHKRDAPMCLETFPHAIVCALSGKVVPAKPKKRQRCEILRRLGYDVSRLPNIDFIDAALCAVTAEEFRIGKTVNFGTCAEGVIVVPEINVNLK